MIDPFRASRKRPELLALLAFALVTCLLLMVLHLGSEIMEGETRSFDVAILTGLRQATEGATPWKTALRAAMLDLTALGDTLTLIIVVAMVTGYLGLARQRRLAVSLVVATASGAVVTTVLKTLIERPRPDIVAHLTAFGGASFPSGHAMNSAVTYLTLAVLIAGAVQRLRLRLYVFACAVVMTIAVGVSRVYLGVHWPTDVLAGWAAGSGWAALCGTTSWWLKARRPAESLRS